MRNLLFFLLLPMCSFYTNTANGQFWNWGRGIKGEGAIVKQTFQLDEFNSLGLGISAEVEIRQGSPQRVVVEGQQNILDNIQREVSGGTWAIKFKKSVSNYEKVKIYVTIPQLEALSVGGSGGIKTIGAFRDLDKLDLSVGGSGSIDADVFAKHIKCSVGGSGDIWLKGKADVCGMSVAGSGDIHAFGLATNECKASVAGSGACEVNARDRLEASVAGSGGVLYEGSPSISSSVAGSGSVERRN